MIWKILSMCRCVYAIDLGTQNTVVYKVGEGIILNEPTMYQSKGAGKIIGDKKIYNTIKQEIQE